MPLTMTLNFRYVRFAHIKSGIQVILEQLRAQGASDEEIERTMEQAKQFYLQQKYPISTPVSYTHLTLPTIYSV